MSGVVVDTSVWIEFFAGHPVPSVEEALAEGSVVLPPLVVSELLSGARNSGDREAILSVLEDLPLHETPREHWMRVGDLRRALKGKGLSVSTPDAHIAQCAIERQAVLVSRDSVFAGIARVSSLRIRSN